MTQLYFAVSSDNAFMRATFGQWDWQEKPLNCLVAFPALKQWEEVQPDPPWPLKKSMLDSGAFAAKKSGKVIDFDKLCEEAKNPRWDNTVALDVIGDPIASIKNTLKMKERGLHVIPVFHFGEPWEMLVEYKKQFPYIGIAGSTIYNSKIGQRWVEQCFARAYPHKIHVFGCGTLTTLLTVPAYSADTATWYSGVRFGCLTAMPGIRIPRKSEAGLAAYDLRSNVLHYLDREAELQERWKKELAWTQE